MIYEINSAAQCCGWITLCAAILSFVGLKQSNLWIYLIQEMFNFWVPCTKCFYVGCRNFGWNLITKCGKLKFKRPYLDTKNLVVWLNLNCNYYSVVLNLCLQFWLFWLDAVILFVFEHHLRLRIQIYFMIIMSQNVTKSSQQ